jgi:hypothetical protein
VPPPPLMSDDWTADDWTADDWTSNIDIDMPKRFSGKLRDKTFLTDGTSSGVF